jgi:hypothetical protein
MDLIMHHIKMLGRGWGYIYIYVYVYVYMYYIFNLERDKT